MNSFVQDITVTVAQFICCHNSVMLFTPFSSELTSNWLLTSTIIVSMDKVITAGYTMSSCQMLVFVRKYLCDMDFVKKTVVVLIIYDVLTSISV